MEPPPSASSDPGLGTETNGVDEAEESDFVDLRRRHSSRSLVNESEWQLGGWEEGEGVEVVDLEDVDVTLEGPELQGPSVLLPSSGGGEGQVPGLEEGEEALEDKEGGQEHEVRMRRLCPSMDDVSCPGVCPFLALQTTGELT